MRHRLYKTMIQYSYLKFVSLFMYPNAPMLPFLPIRYRIPNTLT